MKKSLTAVLLGLLLTPLSASSETEKLSLAMPQCQPQCQPPRTSQPSRAAQPPRSSQPPQVSVDVKLHEQKLSSFKELLDYQDKRVGDLTFNLSISIAFFGALITAIVVFFSFRSTREAVLAAKEEARHEIEKQAENVIESWLNKEGQQLLVNKVDATLEPKISEALGEIRNATHGVLNGLKEEQRRAHDHNMEHEQVINNVKAIQEQLSQGIVKSKSLSVNEIEEVDNATDKLGFKAPNDYQSEDWFMLGKQAYKSAKYEVAKEYFTKAIEIASEPLSKANALIHMGLTYGKLEQSEEEMAMYDEVVRNFGEATELALREKVSRALINKAITLGDLKRSEEEIVVYDEVVRRFGESTELKLCEQVGKVLINKAITLGELKRGEEEVAVYDDIVKRFGDSTEPTLYAKAAVAMVNKGITLSQFGRPKEGDAIFEEVIRRFGNSTEPELRLQVVRALTNKLVKLLDLKLIEEGVAVCEEVVKRFGDATETKVRELVARALLLMGFTLMEFQRGEEALAVYDDIVQRFDAAAELELRETVAMALMSKGVAFEKLMRSEEALAVLNEVVQRYDKATEPQLREVAKRARELRDNESKNVD